MKYVKYAVSFVLLCVSAGCCIGSRSWKIDKEITGHVLPASGTYHCYTNGEMKVCGHYQDGSPYMAPICKYKYCSNTTGPWAGSDIYPATRSVLNALSFMSYSSAASGDYMLNIVILPCYPVVLVELPIQIVLDTILLPWDIIAAPTTPEGYKKVF